MKMEIQGTVVEIIFKNDENGYTIASIDDNMEMVIVVGYMPLIKEGEYMRFIGEPTFHKTYGEQFKVTSSEVIEPKEATGIIKYLGSGIIKGIGPSLAEKIVEVFKETALDVMRYNPEKLLVIPGIGKSKLEQIMASFAEQNAMSEIIMFLQKYNISVAYATKIYNTFKEKTIAKITENPYILAEEVKGIGFKMADEIAHMMGVENDSPYRLFSGIKHVLNSIVNNGHTFAFEHQLIMESCQNLEVTEEVVKQEITELILKGDLHRSEIEGEKAIYLTNYYNAELGVCKKLSHLAYAHIDMINVDMDKELEYCQQNQNIELAEMQKHAIKEAINHGVLVITGGPGTGKTTIINSIIEIFERQKLKVLLAAPTGRAAKRMSEACLKESKTIHRLLEYQYSDSGYLAFNKNSQDPLQADLIIVDEASMLDILLMYSLLDAISHGTRVIFVGDVDQLPAVGAGNVLSDMIDSEMIETVKLTEIFRQAKESMIVMNAHRINTGQMPTLNEKDQDFYFIKAGRPEEVVWNIVNLCKERLPNYYGFDSVRDIQVLAPMKNSPVGVFALNQELQFVLNPESKEKSEKKFGDQIFRVGDKIMQIKNNYNIKWQKKYGFEKGEGVFNGDIGYITDIDTKSKTVSVLFDDERDVIYEFSQMDELVLSYAVTVHKSQGSEFPVVVMPLYNIPPMLRNKNILYTAITRAKALVVLVGTLFQLQSMIENVSQIKRNSGLKMMLKMVKEAYIER
ncbi:MAG: ATP-dependent RecD-like DNA helicase [Clostridia bacterium]|nr:ATP-dependent RecD-like DNA helicase [Clostridia bacterium]